MWVKSVPKCFLFNGVCTTALTTTFRFSIMKTGSSNPYELEEEEYAQICKEI